MHLYGPNRREIAGCQQQLVRILLKSPKSSGFGRGGSTGEESLNIARVRNIVRFALPEGLESRPRIMIRHVGPARLMQTLVIERRSRFGIFRSNFDAPGIPVFLP